MIKRKLTRKKLVNKMDRWLRGNTDGSNSGGAYRDIVNTYERAGVDLAVFILGSCFIDAMAGFFAGRSKPKGEPIGQQFKDFLREYLPQYYGADKGREFYESLRSGLVHNYVSYGKYIFMSYGVAMHDTRISHLQKHPGPNKRLRKKIVVIDKHFKGEILYAYERLKDDILKDDKVFKNALKRYKSLRLMEVVRS